MLQKEYMLWQVGYILIKMGGVYFLKAGDVFRLNRVTHGNKDLCVSASFFEIYCGKVYDLLNEKKKLRILEDAKSKVQVLDKRSL